MVNRQLLRRGLNKGWFNNKVRGRKMDSGEGAVKKNANFLSLARK